MTDLKEKVVERINDWTLQFFEEENEEILTLCDLDFSALKKAFLIIYQIVLVVSLIWLALYVTVVL